MDPDGGAATKLEDLVDFMWERQKAGGNSLEKPTDEPETWDTGRKLRWFTSKTAETFVTVHKRAIPEVEAVFGFAKAFVDGYTFVARSNKLAHFVGYETSIPPAPGMVLLDATADIDGISSLVGWRNHIDLPLARYDNLTIIHKPSVAKGNLSKFLDNATNRTTYTKWIVETIKEHMDPGQRGLVVCKHRLFKDQNIPAWPQGDPRFDQANLYTQQYAWDIEGRKLCATHWGGYGIGSNVWKEADVVFLFDEFYLPRRKVIATGQGLLRKKATKGPIASMNAINSRAPEFDGLQDGHLLRWTKQMALRGKGREFDDGGVCGVQKIVCTGNLKRLIINADRLFPGATCISTETKEHQTKFEALLKLLLRTPQPQRITTKQVGDHVGEPWRSWGKDVTKLPEFDGAVGNTGYRYVSRRGPGGAWFERVAAA